MEESMLRFAQYLHQFTCVLKSRGPRVLRTLYSYFLLLMLWSQLTSPQAHSQVSVGHAVALDAAGPAVVKQVREVDLALTVKDRHGHFVNNLTRSDLRIIDNDDRANEITYFDRRSNLPLRVALVMDTSMSVGYCLDSERKTAVRFLKSVLRPGRDRALIVTFNENVNLAQPPTSDLHLLQHALKRIHVAGETAIYDAVSMASQQLEQISGDEPSRRVIILITDGEDNRSRTTLKQAAEIALRNETSVYVISTNVTTFEDPTADESMKQLSNATGGAFLRADGNVDYAFAKIEKELRSQYVICYKPPSAGPDGQFHRVEVLGSSKLHFVHRIGYFAK